MTRQPALTQVDGWTVEMAGVCGTAYSWEATEFGTGIVVRPDRQFVGRDECVESWNSFAVRVIESSTTAAYKRALACVDRVFQEDSTKPPPILPDFCKLGDDKFEAVIHLAEAYARIKYGKGGE